MTDFAPAAGDAAWDFSAVAPTVLRGRPRSAAAGDAAWSFAVYDGGRYRRALRALSPVDVTLTALEITHPAVAEPIRVVNDVKDHAIEGNAYIGLRFEPRLVSDPDGGNPRAEIKVDNIGAALTDWVERSEGGSGASCRVMRVLAGDNEPEYDVSLGVQSMRVDTEAVSVRLGHENLFGRRAVRRRHDPETSPGVF